MSVIRAFIAISLPADVQQRLEVISSGLRSSLQEAQVRWVPVPNIHLTMMFLGDLSLANLGMLKDNLGAEADSHHCFEFSVGGVGAFPSPQRPRVLWVGVEAPAELNSLQAGITHRMEHLGYAGEERPFSPHLTLGRVARNANPDDAQRISAALQSAKVGFLGVCQVNQVHLFRSDLKPGGAVYTKIFSAPLTPGANLS